MFIELNRDYLISEMYTESDERSGTVETWIPSLYPEATNRLNERMKLLSENDDRLADNYKDINYFDFPFVTTVRRDKEIIECGTGYTCDVYPKNCIRVMNRYYRAPSSRPFLTTEYARPSKVAVIAQQLEMAKRLNCEVAMITRDRAKRHLTKFANALTEKSNYTWEVTNDKCLVTPSYNNPRAWQYIAYTKLQSLDYDFLNHWQTK